MPVEDKEIAIVSEMPEVDTLSFEAEVHFDDATYERFMQRISSQDGAAGTPVSAFNSSI